jgi:hypothetical protein
MNVIHATDGNQVVNLSKYLSFKCFGAPIEPFLVDTTFHLSIFLLFQIQEARKEFEGLSLL